MTVFIIYYVNRIKLNGNNIINTQKKKNKEEMYQNIRNAAGARNQKYQKGQGHWTNFWKF